MFAWSIWDSVSSLGADIFYYTDIQRASCSPLQGLWVQMVLTAL